MPGGTPDHELVIGRDDVIGEILAAAAAGVDQLLADPRRMGKTCAMKRLRHLTPDGWGSSFADFQGVSTVGEFVARAFQQINEQAHLPARAIDSVRGFFAGATLTAGAGGIVQLSKTFESDAIETFEQAVLSLDAKLSEEQRHLLLCWDEVPDLVESIAEREGIASAASFLQTFRRIRQSTRSIRWLVAGSVGFHHIRDRIGVEVDVVNDMQGVPFGPLNEPHARWLADCLLDFIVRDRVVEVGERLVERSGRMPFLLHAIAHQIWQRRPAALAQSDVDDAFVAYVNDTDKSHAVTHFLARIDDYYAEKASLARAILDGLTPRGTIQFDTIEEFTKAISASRDQLLAVLDLLKLDHYLIESVRSGFSWRYPVLGEIWHQRRRI